MSSENRRLLLPNGQRLIVSDRRETDGTTFEFVLDADLPPRTTCWVEIASDPDPVEACIESRSTCSEAKALRYVAKRNLPCDSGPRSRRRFGHWAQA